jgi:hypothetical protein
MVHSIEYQCIRIPIDSQLDIGIRHSPLAFDYICTILSRNGENGLLQGPARAELACRVIQPDLPHRYQPFGSDVCKYGQETRTLWLGLGLYLTA